MGDNPGFEGYENSAQNIHKAMWTDVFEAAAVGEDNETLLALVEDTPRASYLPEGEARIVLIEALDEVPAGGDSIPDPVATIALAGDPGSFTDDDDVPAAPPEDLAAMATVTADPDTQWTVGQHVVLADDSLAYWDDAAWQEGEAPAVVPNIVGLTATAADAALVAAGLTVGTVTTSAGTLDEVLSQGTAAATEVPGGTAVNYVKGDGN